jgi:hypothetical protein
MEKFKLLDKEITLDIAKNICTNISFFDFETYTNSWFVKVIFDPVELEILDNTENELVLEKNRHVLIDGKYTIQSDDLKYGWLRADSINNPLSWHKNPADFIFTYWDDKNTPAPFKEWSKASIMLVPMSNNPKQGHGGSKHGWAGFKRLFYGYGKFDMKKDEEIIQYYMMQLGSSVTEKLPDINTIKIGRRLADPYINAEKLITGTDVTFNIVTGAYKLKYAGAPITLKLDNNTQGADWLAFEITGIQSAPKIQQGGKVLKSRSEKLADGTYLLLLEDKVTDGELVIIP